MNPGLIVLLATFLFLVQPAHAKDQPETGKVHWTQQLGEFNLESELGIVVTGGNSITQNISLKQEGAYTYKGHTVKIYGRYLFSSADDVVYARDWSATLRYGRRLTDDLGLYVSHGWEGNPFSGYDYRANFDFGGKLYLLARTTGLVETELGYRYTLERRTTDVTPAFDRSHFIRLYMEGKKTWLGYIKSRFWIEGLLDVSDTNDFHLNFEPSVAFAINSILSVKLGYLGRFDNSPIGSNKKFDFTYTTALVASI